MLRHGSDTWLRSQPQLRSPFTSAIPGSKEEAERRWDTQSTSVDYSRLAASWQPGWQVAKAADGWSQFPKSSQLQEKECWFRMKSQADIRVYDKITHTDTVHHFWVQDWCALSLQTTSLILTNDYDMVQQYWAATWISSSEPDGFCCVKNSKGSSVKIGPRRAWPIEAACLPGCSLRCSRLWRLLGDTCHHAQRHCLHPLWPEGGQAGKLRPADWNSGFIWIYVDLYGFMWILWFPQLLDTSFGD